MTIEQPFSASYCTSQEQIDLANSMIAAIKDRKKDHIIGALHVPPYKGAEARKYDVTYLKWYGLVVDFCTNNGSAFWIAYCCVPGTTFVVIGEQSQ